MITTVFIDVDDTLLDFKACSLASMRLSANDVGFVCPENMWDAFLPINTELWKRLERGEITREYLHSVRFGMVFDVLGINSDAHEFEKRYLAHLAESGEKMDGAEDLLKYLSAKYKVYVTSNAPHNQQVNRLHTSGLDKYLAGIFTSEKIGVNKPQKGFFDVCINEARVKPDEVVLIGDSLTADIDGGVSYGLKTVWFNLKGVEVPIDFKGDYVVDNLAEIKTIL